MNYRFSFPNTRVSRTKELPKFRKGGYQNGYSARLFDYVCWGKGGLNKLNCLHVILNSITLAISSGTRNTSFSSL